EEFLDGQFAGRVPGANQKTCTERDQRWGRIGCRTGVAEVAAEAGTRLDLDAADKRRSVDKAWQPMANLRVLVEFGQGCRGTNRKRAVARKAMRDQFGDVFEIDQLVAAPPAFAELDDHVRPACEHQRRLAVAKVLVNLGDR